MAPSPFTIDIKQDVLDDLRARLDRTRWPSDLGDAAWKYGASIPYMKGLIAYWRDGFDWRAEERTLNRFPNFRVALKDGIGIHFIHQRGRGPKPFPIVLTHGFPDSVARFTKLIPMLADPASHGGDAADSFDVVAPSLPGFAFSDMPRGEAATFRVGDLWDELMTTHLGYERYGAHGGDWGSMITSFLARDHADHVAGIHLTDVPFLHTFEKNEDLSAAEKKFLDGIAKFQKTDGAYAMVQGTQPQVVAVGLNDSPAGLATWIVEKFRRWSDCDGDVERSFTKDELLTNVMLYWVTGSIISSFLPYYDVTQSGAMTWIGQKVKEWKGSTGVPAGFAMFPKDLSSPPREWAERFYNVQRWTELKHGGHFAALEEPEALAHEIRELFRPLRAAPIPSSSSRRVRETKVKSTSS
jgi:pimeloyl-ACP methyl ester carboxylesterase